MRYKVKVDSGVNFEKAKAVAAADTRVYVVSDRRRVLSTGDLSDAAKDELLQIGATIVPDPQYHADAA